MKPRRSELADREGLDTGGGDQLALEAAHCEDHVAWATFVSLPRVVIRELETHLASGGGPDDHVFAAPQGGTLRIVAFRNRIWRPATEAAGLTGLRIHDLRHTAVALWIAAGASPKEVAVRAGHTSVSFTLDRYGHLYPEADTRLPDQLDTLHATARRPEGVVVDLLAQETRSQRNVGMQ